MEFINKEVFEGNYSGLYRQASPFPHIVLHDLWDRRFLSAVAADAKAFDYFDGQKNFYGSVGKNYCGTMAKLPESSRSLIHFAHSLAFLQMLERMTGEPDLAPDEQLEGGGLHSILPGGFLKVHADFNWNSRMKLFRRLNMIVYLNPGWDERWGGQLQLWDKDMSAVASEIYPAMNTTVIFTTDDTSFHGHPDPLRCPAGHTRDSIALYFYNEKRAGDEHRKQREISIYRPRHMVDLRLRVGKGVERLKAFAPKRSI